MLLIASGVFAPGAFISGVRPDACPEADGGRGGRPAGTSG